MCWEYDAAWQRIIITKSTCVRDLIINEEIMRMVKLAQRAFEELKKRFGKV